MTTGGGGRKATRATPDSLTAVADAVTAYRADPNDDTRRALQHAIRRHCGQYDVRRCAADDCDTTFHATCGKHRFCSPACTERARRAHARMT